LFIATVGETAVGESVGTVGAETMAEFSSAFGETMSASVDSLSGYGTDLSGYGTSVIGRSARAASLGYEAGEFTSFIALSIIAPYPIDNDTPPPATKLVPSIVLPIKTGIATSGTIGSNAIDTTSIPVR
jgi:hypothetical protein